MGISLIIHDTQIAFYKLQNTAAHEWLHFNDSVFWNN
jgi:hypothetical protein